MTSLSKVIFVIFTLLASSNSHGDTAFVLGDAYWTNLNTVKLEWPKPTSLDVVSYSIYIEESSLKGFPTPLVESNIHKEATAWESKPRKPSILTRYIGVDLRSIGQWGDKAVLTAGQIYNIGLRVHYQDKATKKKKELKQQVVLYPMIITDIQNKNKNKESKFSIAKLSNISRQHIFERDGKYIFKYGGINSKITAVSIHADRDVIFTFGKKVEVLHAPNRPAHFGNYQLAKNIFSILGLIIMLIISATTVTLLYQVFNILNISLGENGQEKTIILHAISKGMLGAFSVYIFLKIVIFFNEHESLKYFGIKYSAQQVLFFAAILVIYDKCRVNQWKEIRDSIEDILQPPSVNDIDI